MTAFYIFSTLAGMGMIFGLVLAIANRKLHIEIDPLIHEVEDVLPKGQCGACGYPGCIGYAEAVVNNPNVPPNLCIPGKDEVTKLVAKLTGKTPAPTQPRKAILKCAGSFDIILKNAQFQGVGDCFSAHLLQGGEKACKWGCLGFGNCVKGCVFGAMKMDTNRLPVIDDQKCTGCGACMALCPRNIITMIPENGKVWVHCNSQDKGVISRKLCNVSCIGCRICEKACPHQAVKIENNLAKCDPSICIKCENPVCFTKCPTKAITQIIHT